MGVSGWGSTVRTLAWEAVHVVPHRARITVDRTPPDAFASGWRAPVVLLPGVYEPWRYLLPWARALHERGHPVVVVPELGYQRLAFERAVAVAASAVVAADVRGGVLVGHSKGGLIGKALLLEAGIADRVAGLVAVCTPWVGSARMGGLRGRALRRTALGVFAPGGAELGRLAALIQADARITSIQPAWDEFIPAVAGGGGPPGSRTITLGVSGHFRPVVDPAVHGVLAAEVARLAEGS